MRRSSAGIIIRRAGPRKHAVHRRPPAGHLSGARLLRYRDTTMATQRSEGTKNMVLRLDPELAERLQVVAEVEGRTVSDVVREAITRLVEQRRRDKRFIKLLEANVARHQRLLELLRDDSA